MKPLHFNDALDVAKQQDGVALVLANVATLQTAPAPEAAAWMRTLLLDTPTAVAVRVVEVLEGPEELHGASLQCDGGVFGLQPVANGLLVCMLQFHDNVGWHFHRDNVRLAPDELSQDDATLRYDQHR